MYGLRYGWVGVTAEIYEFVFEVASLDVIFMIFCMSRMTMSERQLRPSSSNVAMMSSPLYSALGILAMHP